MLSSVGIVDTMEARVQALELAVFDLENVKGLLSLRMEDLEDEIERKRWHAAHGLS